MAAITSDSSATNAFRFWILPSALSNAVNSTSPNEARLHGFTVIVSGATRWITYASRRSPRMPKLVESPAGLGNAKSNTAGYPRSVFCAAPPIPEAA